jgi:hypothetical protein
MTVPTEPREHRCGPQPPAPVLTLAPFADLKYRTATRQRLNVELGVGPGEPRAMHRQVLEGPTTKRRRVGGRSRPTRAARRTAPRRLRLRRGDRAAGQLAARAGSYASVVRTVHGIPGAVVSRCRGNGPRTSRCWWCSTRTAGSSRSSRRSTGSPTRVCCRWKRYRTDPCLVRARHMRDGRLRGDPPATLFASGRRAPSRHRDNVVHARSGEAFCPKCAGGAHGNGSPRRRIGGPPDTPVLNPPWRRHIR